MPNEKTGTAGSFLFYSAFGIRHSAFLPLALLALFAAAKPILFDTLDPDCFWHLKVAEQLRVQGIGPIVDALSYNSIKAPWTPYSWLAELGMKALWDAGGFRAAILVQSLLQAAFVVLLALCARTRRRDNPLGTVVAVAIGLFYSLPYLSFRPVTLAIDLLALIAWLTLRDTDCLSPVSEGEGTGKSSQASGKTVWLVPPLTALLTNVHFFSLLVPMIFAARVVGGWMERRTVRRDLALLLATSLACCLTPMLPGMVAAVGHYQFADAAVSHRLAAEFAPIYSGPLGPITVILLIVWLIATLRSDLRLAEKLWAVGFAVLLLRMGRFAPVFAPIGAATAAFVMPTLSSKVLQRRSLRWAMAAVLLIGVGRLCLSFPSTSQSFSTWLNRNGPDTPGYPTAATDYVAAHVPPGRLLNEFSWGGYLEWRLGADYPAFIDGRTQLFPPTLWRTVADGSFALDATANAAIVPRGRGTLRARLIDAGWTTAFQDDRAEVFIPPVLSGVND